MPPLPPSTDAAHIPGMSTHRNRQPDGIPVGGQYAATNHRPAGLDLDPAAPAAVVLADVAELLGEGIGEELKARLETEDPEELLAEMEAENVNGRCPQDAGNTAFNPAWCPQCVRAQALEYRIRPTPDPAVYGVIPPGVPNYRLEKLDEPSFDPETHTTTTVLDGEDSFNKAARALLDVGDDAPVSVTEAVTDMTPQWWTCNFATEITVSSGDRSATYPDLGALMRAVDAGTRPEVEETALRFCQSPGVQHPLLDGTAAVCLWAEDGGGAEVLYGRILMVHMTGGHSVAMLLRDGSQRDVPMEDISAILETAETVVLPER